VTRRPPRFFLAVAAALAAGAAGLPAAAEQQHPPDLSILNRAGASFPERLGRFVRVGVTSIQPGRVEAHYLLPAPGSGSPAMDIFVGPATADPAAELEATQTMIASIFEDLQPLRDLAPPPAAPAAAGRIWKGRLNGQPILTVMMVSRRGVWRIKIRATLAEEIASTGLPEVERAIREYGWWKGPPFV
jgi:hypothetical protein